MRKYNFFSKAVIFAYVKSMRPYLFFLSGMAGWLGVLFSGATSSVGRTTVVLSVVFIGWGVNQVINDLLGLKEDKINAPHRPLITGELPIKQAVIFSIFFFVLGGLITFLLNPKALVLFILVFVLNIVYEYSKGVPILGNVIFGVLLAPCVYYGAMCVNNKGLEILFDGRLTFIAIAVVLINSTVAFFTYFKDFAGDKTAGKKTIVVCLTPEKAKYLNFFMSLLPFSVLFFWGRQASVNTYFLILMASTFFILQYTAFLYFRNAQGEDVYYSLKWNFRGAVLFETSFVALVYPFLAVVLYLINFITVGALFELHQDPLS